jgi:hypothetical protein
MPVAVSARRSTYGVAKCSRKRAHVVVAERLSDPLLRGLSFLEQAPQDGVETVVGRLVQFVVETVLYRVINEDDGGVDAERLCPGGSAFDKLGGRADECKERGLRCGPSNSPPNSGWPASSTSTRLSTGSSER